MNIVFITYLSLVIIIFTEDCFQIKKKKKMFPSRGTKNIMRFLTPHCGKNNAVGS